MSEVNKSELQKKWVFRMFVYALILNIMVFWLTMTTPMSLDPEWNYTFSRNMMIFGLMETVCLIIGIILLVLYVRKNKLRGRKLITATIGLSLFAVLKLITIVMA